MDTLNEVMEQIRPLNDALTEKARLAHALRKLIVEIERHHVYGAIPALAQAVAEAKEALK